MEGKGPKCKTGTGAPGRPSRRYRNLFPGLVPSTPLRAGGRDTLRRAAGAQLRTGLKTRHDAEKAKREARV